MIQGSTLAGTMSGVSINGSSYPSSGSGGVNLDSRTSNQPSTSNGYGGLVASTRAGLARGSGVLVHNGNGSQAHAGYASSTASTNGATSTTTRDTANSTTNRGVSGTQFRSQTNSNSNGNGVTRRGYAPSVAASNSTERTSGGGKFAKVRAGRTRVVFEPAQREREEEAAKEDDDDDITVEASDESD